MPETVNDLLALHPLLPPAWAAAHRAALFLRDERPDDLVIDSKSTPTDVVSAMDRDAEAMIVADLLGARPDDGLLGEEGGERQGTSGVRWVVDPLDGTVNYLHHLPMWGVSIGVEVDGVPEAGVIVLPAFGESYLAARGRGAWLVTEGAVERLTGSSCDSLASAIVATGFGYAPARRVRQAEVVRGLVPVIADIRRMGAAVVDFCWLARGRIDAYFEAGLNPWDRCAGGLIVQEAGVAYVGLHEEEPPDFFVAAAPGIVDDLCGVLREVRADDV